MSEQWDQSRLQNLIADKVQEYTSLEYKAADALQKTEGKKKDISIDVSAMANSAGGVIIYGMKEFDQEDKRHLPERFSPIDTTKFSKEWLEQVILDNIQPRVSKTIHVVDIKPRPSDVVYVVEVPQSHTAHQAKDKRYYKRFDFQVRPMEDYEIRDVMSRQESPDLIPFLDKDSISYRGDEIVVPIRIQNNSYASAKEIRVVVRIMSFEETRLSRLIGFRHLSPLNNYDRETSIINKEPVRPVHYGIHADVGTLGFTRSASISRVEFRMEIVADSMKGKYWHYSIETQEDTQTFTLHDEGLL